MGHHVTITSAQFHIHPDQLDAACQALKDLNKSDKGKSGLNFGLLPDGTRGITGRVFSWMPANYDETMHTAQEILEAVGFTVHMSADDGLVIAGFDGPTGDEDVFLDALGPFVTAGSYLKWRSEDALLWEDRFDGTQRRTFTGHATYIS